LVKRIGGVFDWVACRGIRLVKLGTQRRGGKWMLANCPAEEKRRSRRRGTARREKLLV